MSRPWPSPRSFASSDGRTAGDLSHALALLGGSESEEIRRETAVFARGLDLELRRPAIRRLLGDPAGTVRAAALEAIGDDVAGEGILGDLLHLARDPSADVRAKVLPLLARAGYPRLESALRAALGDESPKVRRIALDLLGEHGSAAAASEVLVRVTDPEAVVRVAAIRAAARLAPAEAVERAVGLLGDPEAPVKAAAVATIDACLPPEDRIPRAIAALARPDARAVVPALLEIAVRHDPDRAISGADATPRAPWRWVFVAVLVAQSRVPNLAALAPELLTCPHAGLRMAAVEALRTRGVAVAVEDLLPLARDADGGIRDRALRVLATIDDPRVFGEFVSSLRDVDPDVAEHARELLSDEDEGDAMPVLRRFQGAPGDPRKPWDAMLDRVEQVSRWASRVGQELLGTPVVVHQYRQGLGRTQGRRSAEVHIEVSDIAMTSGHRHGEDIVKGLALHEIGHHLFDNAERGNLPIRGIARSEGVGDIDDLLLDERLERLLRTRRPEWGRYLDRLASYAFTQDAQQAPLEEYALLVGLGAEDVAGAIRSGDLPGAIVGDPPRVEFRDLDLLSVPGAIPPFAAFLLSLRCGIDPARVADARVRAALALLAAGLPGAAAPGAPRPREANRRCPRSHGGREASVPGVVAQDAKPPRAAPARPRDPQPHARDPRAPRVDGRGCAGDPGPRDGARPGAPPGTISPAAGPFSRLGRPGAPDGPGAGVRPPRERGARALRPGRPRPARRHDPAARSAPAGPPRAPGQAVVGRVRRPAGPEDRPRPGPEGALHAGTEPPGLPPGRGRSRPLPRDPHRPLGRCRARSSSGRRRSGRSSPRAPGACAGSWATSAPSTGTRSSRSATSSGTRSPPSPHRTATTMPGGLLRAADLAFASGKRNKLIVMISDGLGVLVSVLPYALLAGLIPDRCGRGLCSACAI